MSTYFYVSKTYDGWRNLSYDRFFLDNLKYDDILLYFYVNENAVIIGKNQNAWKECNFKTMEEDDVQLVRRHTGGGAVYHDRGNLNFSLIMNEERFDIPRQMNVIIDALSKFGINAEMSGRNDILAEGKKFSGNAFGVRGNMRAHHGTLLIDADLNKLPRYLNVSEKKIRSKGIDSVRARVVNLTELSPDVTVDNIRSAVIDSFERQYGKTSEYPITDEDTKEIDRIYDIQSSWDYNVGESPKFDYLVEDRLGFGEIQMLFSLEKGYIKNIKVFSDSLDTGIVDILQEVLLGIRFDNEDIIKQLEDVSFNTDIAEIADYFRENPL